MNEVAERIKEQSAQYQVGRLRVQLDETVTLRKAETSQYVKDLQVLVNYIQAVASDIPEEVNEVIARAEELLTIKRLRL
jgi:hypothetical protein